MHPHLHKINECISKLNADCASALKEITVTRQYKKGSYLLRQGEVCKKSFYIEAGVARKFYPDGDKEITTEFFFPQDIAVSFDSYCLQQPAREYIEALSDLTVSQTDYSAFTQLKQQYPVLTALDLLLTEYYALWLEERLLEFHTLDATARYKKLLNEQAHILQQVPLTYIASYLGVSLETLSRIRAKLAG